MEQYTISIINRKQFAKRLHLENDFGAVLHDQLIALLEVIAEEKDSKLGITDIRLGVYLDTKNDGVRYFILGEKEADLIFNNFGHKFFGELKKYSEREQKKGTDILYQLNNGSLSIKDFEDNI